MKRKSLFLKLKKFTIASVGVQYQIIGAGQTNDQTCTDEPTVNGDTCNYFTVVPDSCTSSTKIPISDARVGCNASIGGGD